MVTDAQTLFRRFDKDGSGFIEVEELEALLRALDADGRDDDALLVAMSHLKPAHPDRVSWEEFRVWWEGPGSRAVQSEPAPKPPNEYTGPGLDERKNQAIEEQNVRTIFTRFDRDGSGEIDIDELASLLEALDMDPDDEQVEAALERLDKDDSGRLSWDEFRVWFKDHF